MWSFGLRVYGLGVRVQGVGFRITGLGFRVEARYNPVNFEVLPSSSYRGC